MPSTWGIIKEASGSSGCLIFHTKRRLKKTCCSVQIYMQRPCQQVFSMILRIKTCFQVWKNFTVWKIVFLTAHVSTVIFRFMKNTIINRKFVYTYNNVTAILVAVNIAVFCLTYFLFPRLTYTLALVPSSVYYGHSYWQFVTYMFTHGSISHLLFNMLSLYIFGTAVERRVGSKEFLLYYMLTGTLCGFASYGVYYLANTNVVLMGASGAIYALLMLFSVLYPRAVIYVFGIIPVPAPVLIILYFVIELFSGMMSFDGVAHMTHLFGLVFGLLYILIRMRLNPLKEWRRWDTAAETKIRDTERKTWLCPFFLQIQHVFGNKPYIEQWSWIFILFLWTAYDTRAFSLTLLTSYVICNCCFIRNYPENHWNFLDDIKTYDIR